MNFTENHEALLLNIAERQAQNVKGGSWLYELISRVQNDKVESERAEGNTDEARSYRPMVCDRPPWHDKPKHSDRKLTDAQREALKKVTVKTITVASERAEPTAAGHLSLEWLDERIRSSWNNNLITGKETERRIQDLRIRVGVLEREGSDPTAGECDEMDDVPEPTATEPDRSPIRPRPAYDISCKPDVPSEGEYRHCNTCGMRSHGTNAELRTQVVELRAKLKERCETIAEMGRSCDELRAKLKAAEDAIARTRRCLEKVGDA